MPCIAPPKATPQYLAKVKSALERLNAALAAGTVTVSVGAQGAIAFKGWNDRDGVSDICAFRKLTSDNSPALRRAVMRAEVMAGRKIDARTIAQGMHSHDGGQTWSKH